MANLTAAAGAGFTPEQDKILSKVLWRIVPFLLLCYIVAYLDRVNVGIASLTMNGDLGLSPSAFGWSCSSSAISWQRCRVTLPCKPSAPVSGSPGS